MQNGDLKYHEHFSAMKQLALFFVIIFGCSQFILSARAAEPADSGHVTAVRITTPITIDGKLTDAAWQTAIPATHFTQSNPTEYATPTMATDARVLYDDDALYIGARMPDSAPDSIVALLTRRDMGGETDCFICSLDPYHDHRSGNYFGVSAGGARYDGVRYNDSWSDDSWDGVWEGKATRDSLGWTAELKIPFSQLRFHPQDSMTWGINFKRHISRRAEDDLLAFTPKNGSGFVSRFWHLEGLTKIPAAHHVEFLPYVRTRAEAKPVASGDPLNKKHDYGIAAGADAKIGIGSNLILDATVNPDFGQVEVDPAVVNLTDVETYYQEKRPFFMEGAKNFEFGVGGASDYWGFNWPGVDFFYSRRIGRAPQSVPDYNYADVPVAAHIGGAAKLTGKLNGGWNIGSLHAYTTKETGKIIYNDERKKLEVEPAAYYMISRAQKEIAGGLRGIGCVVTATHRFFRDDRVRADVNSNAFTGGLDGWTSLDKNKTYVLTAWGGLSHVQGSRERMVNLQTSSRHYFQRPDAAYLHLDSNATAMTGFAGRMTLNKEKGNVILNASLGTINPKFDANDLGFIYRTDIINAHVGTGYQWTNPTTWTRYANCITAAYGNWNYGGRNTWAGLWSKTQLNFLNYYSANVRLTLWPSETNTTRTRGGPRTLNQAGLSLEGEGYTDSRKPLVFGLGTYGSNSAADNWNRGIWGYAEWKPASNVSLNLSPQIYWGHDLLEWVGEFDDATVTNTYGKRYVFAEMKQLELGSPLRVNWTFTPALSLQLYMQPLYSTGDYFGFKELAKPGTNDYHCYSASEISYSDGNYTVIPSGAEQAFSFSQPDYSFASLRGNVILRWEYSPGSTFYLVWTNSQSQSESQSLFDWTPRMEKLMHTNADNIVLLKATYWFNR
jgi:hypothetical protein